MKRKGWYLTAYDIADPKRLKKVHRRIGKTGLAVQKSVFLLYGDENAVNRVLDKLAGLMDPHADDLRAYPITHPRDVWTNGPNPMADIPVVHLDDDRPIVRKRPSRKSPGFLRRIFRK